MTATALATWIVAVARPTRAHVDKGTALEQACEVIVDAGRAGARLVVLPMACYPDAPAAPWPSRSPWEGMRLHPDLSSLANFPGEATDRLARMAQRARACVVIGAQEWNAAGTARAHALLAIDAQGRILGVLRAPLRPRAAHHQWAAKPSAMLQVFNLPEGPVRTVIGAEHVPAAAHVVLAGRSADLYIAYGGPTTGSMSATLRRIARHERLYVIGFGYMLPAGDQSLGHRDSIPGSGSQCAGCTSTIIDPEGETIAGILHRNSPCVLAHIDLRRRFDACAPLP